jgi:hypothetical protein
MGVSENLDDPRPEEAFEMTTDPRISEYYRRILRWVHTYPLPPHGFDPLTAGDRALAEHGLPARPDPRLHGGALFDFWKRMVGPPIQFRVPTFPYVEEPRVLAFMHHHLGAPALRTNVPRLTGFHHRSNSRNWSGACITPVRPHRFTHVTGAWRVPQPTVPRVPPSGADRVNEDYRSSTWLGLGGHRPYNSLPQIGTSQHLKLANGAATEEYGAWWQWWVKGRPDHHIPMPITNFPVRAGDSILASVTVEPPGDVLFHMTNETAAVFVTFKVVAPANIEPLGSSAEWIHERPTEFNSDRMYPLPNCTKVEFEDCRAMSAPSPGGPETVQTLVGSRQIRMTEIFDGPHRSALVSKPHVADETRLSIEYCEAEA